MIKGIGVDIVEIGRIRRIIENQGERFIQKVFTPLEQEYCLAHRDPAPHFAARFAAKEAVFKALGTGWAEGVSWHDAEVRRQDGGAPVLALAGEAANLCRASGVSSTHLSLSHSNDSAVAMVVLEK
jgi:holo-[acyl-carrier protein] synthase